MNHDKPMRAESVLAARSDDVRDVYDSVANRYEGFRELWLRLAGDDAERALLDDVRAVIRPGARVLDAGAGTGALTRRILAIEPNVQMTLLDLSPNMLRRAADVPGEHLVGTILDLPFADDSFDLVVCGWVIETVPDPRRAIQECLRVVRPSGQLLYTFCSLPQGFLSRAGSGWLRHAVKRGFAGDFLEADRTPWHDCERSHRARFHGGLTTEIALRKCCRVAPYVLPERAGRRSPAG